MVSREGIAAMLPWACSGSGRWERAIVMYQCHPRDSALRDEEEGCPSVGVVGEARPRLLWPRRLQPARRVTPKPRRWRYSHGLIRRCKPVRGGDAQHPRRPSGRRCRRLRSSGVSRSCSLQEPQIERREHQDNPDVCDQALQESVPEEQDVHADYRGSEREHVKPDLLPSHRSERWLS